MSVNEIYSGKHEKIKKVGGHVQGIAVDLERGFVYFSFTTVLLKTDLEGNPIGTAINLAGHLGCITFDKENNKVYGSLELKHDAIGQGIINKIGYDSSPEDSFYLVSFDVDKIDRMDMDVEKEGIMKAVCLHDVIADYAKTDEISGKKHRYGCSGVDGTALGPVFGKNCDSEKKIMIAYGVYSDLERDDTDCQVILQFSRDVFEKYGKALNQARPHRSGPEHAEERYFLYTGNTTYGIQNLEYDPYSNSYFVAVYEGQKDKYSNFPMFVIDNSVSPRRECVRGRGEEIGNVLTLAKIGEQDKSGEEIYGTRFPLGQTGIASMGDGTFYISTPMHDDGGHSSLVKKYTLDMSDPMLFSEVK